jgi:alpha-galactosidase
MIRTLCWLGVASALDNGVGLTPPMGFNTYQSPWPFQGGFAMTIADALTKHGLKDLGFVYVNSDAGWQPKTPGRNASGAPVPDAECPMPSTCQQLEAKGFKMGLYSALSSVQCGGAPGGLYHEDVDAATYANWGLSYLKYDNCAEYALEPNARNSPMRDALNRTKRPILYSTEPFHLTPNPQAHIANLWRTTTDISDDVSKVRVNIDLNDKWAEFAGPGAFNDPDMLQCGKGKSTVNQHRSNFITWAIAKSPLLLSANLTDLAARFPTVLSLIKTKGIIDINQCPDGIQARKLLVDDEPVGKMVGVESCATPDMMAMAAATNAAVTTIKSGSKDRSNDGSRDGSVYSSMAEVSAAKQQWQAVPIVSTVDTTSSAVGTSDAAQGATSGVVQLKHGFYSNRCLSLQPPNQIVVSGFPVFQLVQICTCTDLFLSLYNLQLDQTTLGTTVSLVLSTCHLERNNRQYSPPFRHPTRPHPRPIWSALWQAVLAPCNSSR